SAVARTISSASSKSSDSGCRAESRRILRRQPMRRCGWAMVLVSLALAGCVNPFTTPKTRMLSAEDAEREKDLELPIVGDLTEVANVMPLAVSGVGLVTGLDGT